jgi:uncharacterized protein YdhG (YjbR/CyaY superfamily)
MNEVDIYISTFPVQTQERLEQMRKLIKETAPEAKEVISYGIPTCVLHGNLIHFGGFKNHLGFYPGPNAIVTFKDELVNFKQAKGSIQFPVSQPMPLDVIRKIVLLRVEENKLKAAKKNKV